MATKTATKKQSGSGDRQRGSASNRPAPSRSDSGTGQGGNRPSEWIVGGLSGAVILAIIVFLAYQGFVSGGRVPLLEARIENVDTSGGTSRIAVTVTNSGSRTASEVVVTGTLEGDPQQQLSLRFDYVPAGSTRRGSFLVDAGREDELRLRVSSHVEP